MYCQDQCPWQAVHILMGVNYQWSLVRWVHLYSLHFVNLEPTDWRQLTPVSGALYKKKLQNVINSFIPTTNTNSPWYLSRSLATFSMLLVGPEEKKKQLAKFIWKRKSGDSSWKGSQHFQYNHAYKLCLHLLRQYGFCRALTEQEKKFAWRLWMGV